MIISINQPAYLPWLGYFNRIIKSDLHVVLDTVQFEKNSFINRNRIIINHKPVWLTVPVLTKNLFGKLAINTVEIDNKMAWNKKHFLSLRQAYSKNRFFCDMEEFLENLYANEQDKLIYILMRNINFFIEYLSIKTPIVYASDYYFKECKSDLVLEICEKFGAKKYISGALGRNYLDISKFHAHGITVEYDDYIHPFYDQGHKEFTPYLSAIDLLVRFGKKSRMIIENV